MQRVSSLITASGGVFLVFGGLALSTVGLTIWLWAAPRVGLEWAILLSGGLILVVFLHHWIFVR